MPDLSRRRFLAASAAAAGAVVVGGVPAGHGALASPKPPKPPRGPRHHDLRDVKLVVVLMQENRSFEVYLGSLRGVRGLGDRWTIALARAPRGPIGCGVERRI